MCSGVTNILIYLLSFIQILNKMLRTFYIIIYFLDCFPIRWLKIMLEDGKSLCRNFRFFRLHFLVLHQPVHHSQMNVSTYNMCWVALPCKYSLLLIKILFIMVYLKIGFWLFSLWKTPFLKSSLKKKFPFIYLTMFNFEQLTTILHLVLQLNGIVI